MSKRSLFTPLRLVKYLASGLALLCIGVLLALLVYNFAIFQPHRHVISELLAKATAEERALPPAMRHLLKTSLCGKESTYTARLIWRSCNPDCAPAGSVIEPWLWEKLVQLHLSEDEQYGLIASSSYMGNGRYGFSNEAMARFQRPLASLSETEMATLVALVRAPSAYSSSAERLSKARDTLLKASKEQP
ncbi:transglycosylase domain-containing protein [Chitinilyticum aquatile]|uniref:transglycosylase domain-containing protein n=1 Tax=Chitinilyticum aquatile TaxID=362520 RepID=UPI000422903C|nr:transglycosylase domain-containing protein [Chitinilyticum aquatile]